eukprot:568241-Alexandrium_andersonii.AAC.1
MSSTSSGDRERFVATAWNSDRDVARLSRDVGDMDRPTGQVDFKEGNAHVKSHMSATPMTCASM